IKFVQDNFTPFCIDINMGCPVKKVLKSKAGAYLLTDLNRAKKIIETATKVSKIPISVKVRLGWDEKNMIYKELANIIENEGVSFLTVHGRTKSQLYSGHVQYDKIAEIKSLLKIPVIGNGDVVDLKTLEYIKNTGVDAVMIGRGMMKSPWIFEALNNGREPLHYLSGDKIIDILNDFLMDWKIYKGEKHYLEPFKKFVIWFSKGYKNSSHFRTEVYATDGEDSLVSLYTEFFKKAELISSHN
ncbi:MAG: tRNA-dihydrouridine synthase family protein, partial [Deferribacterales bacterium]